MIDQIPHAPKTSHQMLRLIPNVHDKPCSSSYIIMPNRLLDRALYRPTAASIAANCR